MTEYIKREDAILAITRKHDEVLSVAEAIEDLESAPSANVVEIKKDGEWDMFDLISSAYYGKGMYFKQDNGTVYSRHSGKYMTVDEAIKEFISLIDEDVICVPSVTTVWGDGEAPTYVLQKRGKWIEHGEPNAQGQYEAWYYYCSLCGQVGIKQYSFCPHCGADMRGREDERTD